MDIVKRAASLFEHLVVAVYDQPPGGTLFTTQERVDLYREAVKDYPNVTVHPFKGLMVDFARKMGATFIVRGIRAVTGFEYEFDMALMNKKMAPEIESVYLMASLEHLFVSASRIREVAGLGHDITNLVPPHVAEALREKFSHG
jgi:pantetheine-phosphate adenylyltransferase